MKKLALMMLIVAISLVLPKKAFATQAQLACSPTTSTLAVGDTIITDIILNTRNYEITGADAVLTYTTGVLDTTTADLEAVITDTSWTDPTKKTVDPTLGKIELDYGSSQTPFTSSGTIGTITFTAKQAGIANVNFVFFGEYDNTTAGVAKAWGEKTTGTKSNVLTDIVNCSYTVTGATDTPAPTPTSPPGVSPNPPPALPRTGNGDLTLLLVVGGIIMALSGLFLPRAISKLDEAL